MGNTLFGGPAMVIDRLIVAEPDQIQVGVCGFDESKNKKNTLFSGPAMVIDRIIVAEPHRIEVGVYGFDVSKNKENNPYKSQVIRVNNGPLKSLVNYTETSNSLIYDFEDNIKLQLTKREKDIVYHIKTEDIEHTSNMNPLVRQIWKTISLKSKELDKIADFVKPRNND